MNHLLESIDCSFILTHSFIYSFLLWNGGLVMQTTGSQSTTHIIPHVASIRCLRNMLLLETFARYLLGIALVIWPTATHTILEAFTAADRTTRSVLLYTCCARGSWTYWHSGAGLSGITSLHIVCTLCHTNSWARLELLYGLSVADTNSGLVLILRLLIGTICRLLILLLLLVHICT